MCGSLWNVVLLLTTTAKPRDTIVFIGLLKIGRYVFERDCDCCHHSVVYMPVIKKSTKKAIKIAFLKAGYEFQPHSILCAIYLICVQTRSRI
jgi:hypothetical protein